MRITSRRLAALAATVALAGTLAACGDSEGGGYGGGGGTSAPPDTSTGSPSGGGAAGSGAALTTGETDLGTIVVDGEGMTVYYYTPDEAGSGTSECTDECLAAWPPVHATGGTPEVEGVTAEVDTITGNDGEPQVTLDGRPVYLYAGDGAPGDVAGQGLQDVWWVVAPDGSEITTMAGSGDGGY